MFVLALLGGAFALIYELQQNDTAAVPELEVKKDVASSSSTPNTVTPVTSRPRTTTPVPETPPIRVENEGARDTVALEPKTVPDPAPSADPKTPVSAPAPRAAVTVATAPPEPVIAPGPRIAADAVAATTPSPKPAPMPEVAKTPPAPAREPVPPAELKRDAHGFIIYNLAKRIDNRPYVELEKDLLAAREVALDGAMILTPGPGLSKKGGAQNLPPGITGELIALAKIQKESGQTYAGTVAALGKRPDLAGLPFRIGLDAVMRREKAEAMNTLSKELRQTIQSCIPATGRGSFDTRPDTEELYQTLIAGKKGGFSKRDRKQWATAEAVPCIQQMLQVENRDIRRMACELLQGIEVPEATGALVRWAVFDTDAANRAAAIDALRKRDRKEVSQLLVRYIRYPWPRAVEHAAEALVALDCQDAIPQLVAAYGQPDPDAPFQVELPGKASGMYRYEVVRLNHLHNCVMCHAPSFQRTDMVRGAVPNPSKPLPPPTTPSYYDHGENFVEADITYLQQDFSLMQPVANPGNWPTYQRYDYFVTIRRDNTQPSQVPSKPQPDSTYRRALLFAITELALRDPDADAQWAAEQRKTAGAAQETRLVDAARFMSLQTNPNALAAIKTHEFEKPLLAHSSDELSQAVKILQKNNGNAASRLALIAYMTPLTQTGEPADQAKASRLLAVLMGNTPDANLPTAIKKAADETGDNPKP